MEEHHLLEEQLAFSLSWKQAHLSLLSLFIIGLIRARSVNLVLVAETFGGFALDSSHYKRIQRFLSTFTMDYDQVARLIAKWVLPKGKWLLCLDRTNWKYGKTNINILVLAVAVKGVAIPVFWKMLDKQGNSNTKERKDLMDRFLNVFGKESIKCITADREFKGGKWLKYLKEKEIPFCLRIPVNTKVNNRFRNKKLPVKRLFCLQNGESMVLNTPRKVWGETVKLACFRSSNDWVIIICNESPELALKNYQERWMIETLFQALKGRGFNLEDTHLQKQERISKLFAVLTLAFCWCYKVGEWRNSVIPIKIKSHGRLAKSVFRYGVEWLRQLFNDIRRFGTKVCRFIKLIAKEKPDERELSYLFDIKAIN